MTCQTIMLANPKTVTPDDSVTRAVELMRKYGIRSIPVVDDKGGFVGSFTTIHLIKLLLPTVATMDPVYGSLDDLTFMHDTLGDLRERLDELRHHKVGDDMDTEDIPTVYADTSILEGLLLLYQHRTHVPVVEKDSNSLVGVLTFDCVLKAIAEEG